MLVTMSEETGDYWQGDSVRLRAWGPDDWQHDRLWQLDSIGSRDAGLVQYPLSEPALRKEGEEQSLRRLSDGTESIKLVIETLYGEAVGCINTGEINRTAGSFSYGLYVTPDARRKGYASEAILLLVRYYFMERRYQKVNALVYAFNQASARLHERLEFVQEGRLRRMFYADGAYHDVLHFGMTIEEFQAHHADWLSRRVGRLESTD